jgi:hypothetical protein
LGRVVLVEAGLQAVERLPMVSQARRGRKRPLFMRSVYRGLACDVTK